MSNGIDLGTYHVRVRFTDGQGFIMKWDTGRRYCLGRYDHHPLTATAILPTWKSEDDLASSMEYQFTDGNYGCDCNLSLFLADAAQAERPDETECGETLRLAELTMIRPDGSERTLRHE